MPEFIPLALACGHIAVGWTQVDIGDGETTVLCGECNTWQPFVADPFESLEPMPFTPFAGGEQLDLDDDGA